MNCLIWCLVHDGVRLPCPDEAALPFTIISAFNIPSPASPTFHQPKRKYKASQMHHSATKRPSEIRIGITEQAGACTRRLDSWLGLSHVSPHLQAVPGS